MSISYSTYEAKARFSELLRRVRAGQRVVITHHGKRVAEVRAYDDADDVTSRLRRAEDSGTLRSSTVESVQFPVLMKRRGALSRFLKTRE